MKMASLINFNIAALLTILFNGFCCTVNAQTKPNILLIAVDDMNNYVGCMGGPALTPNIDALAKKGMLFNNAYCAAPACNPSRVAIMTGLRPETTGQYTNQGNFRDIGNNKTILTLPQKLMNAGYETVAAGKIFHYPNGTNPIPNPLSDPTSWTKQVVGQTGTSLPASYRTKAGVAVWLGNDTLDYTNGKKVDYLAGTSIWGPNTQKKEQTGDWQMSEACVEFLNQQHNKPFFFALGFSKPHQPLIAPKEFFDLYPLDKLGTPDYNAADMDDVPDINKQNFSSPFVDKVRKQQQLQLAYQAYLACMSFTDACIGNVLDALKNSKYASNTIVIFFTDHGFQLGTKNRWEKYSLWKLATNSPLIVYIPDSKLNGAVCSEAVSLMDIHSTVLEATGINLTENLDCVSLMPQIKKPDTNRKIPAVITHEEGNHSIVWKQFNYIRYKNGAEEFYDHTKDNLEYQNEAANKAYRRVRKKLKQFIPEIMIPQNSNQKKTMGTVQ
jgi:arylsulfatase A-like enzyme